ncbi:MAG: hypothetical protein U5K69_10265 [Balneolaceae bacterium]|nr:hypothetical protein [Balneolaceae bacterium]
MFITLMVLPLVSAAQISGNVLEAGTDQPLPGANIVVKGTQTGASAGAEWSFYN